MATAGLTVRVDPGASPYRAILKLATPTVIAMLSQSVVNEIDVVFFSHLPCPEASNGQAALLPSLIIVWLFGGSLSAVSVGTQALTARRVAEGQPKAAGAVLANAVWFTLVAGGLMSVLGLVLLPVMLGGMIKVPEVRSIATEYSQWRLMGVISMAMTMAIKAFFDGIGRTHVHLVSALVMNAFNVLFCWMFIFGHMGAPAMGAPGAGVAAFLATWIGLFIMILFASATRHDYAPIRGSNISRALTWDILKLSVPAAGATIAMMAGFAMFSRVVGELDATDAAAAASTASTQLVEAKCGAREAVNSAATTDIVEILKLTFTACIGFGTATATLVGQSLGAKRPDDAERYGWASVRLGVVIFGIVGLCEGVLFTPQIVGIITQSEAVRAAAMMPMRMMGIATPIIAIAMIMSEALFGAGNTKFVAVAQFTLVFGCLVPTAYLLGVQAHLGLVGIWIAACIYSMFAAITMSAKFRAGGWKKIVL
jgi:multidrug resistance protein, MATE family